MRGKFGLVIGLGVGYVLGTRAGRQRYEQIKAQALKVWNLDPVQAQVTKVTDFGKSAVLALPKAVFNSAVKITKAASGQGTAGQKLDSAIKAGRESVDDVAKGAEVSAAEVKQAADDALDGVAKAAGKDK